MLVHSFMNHVLDLRVLSAFSLLSIQEDDFIKHLNQYHCRGRFDDQNFMKCKGIFAFDLYAML